MGVMIEGPCRHCGSIRTPYGAVKQPSYTMYFCVACGHQVRIERKTLKDTQREMSRLKRKLLGG